MSFIAVSDCMSFMPCSIIILRIFDIVVPFPCGPSPRLRART
jgi:hypothetical protein